MVRGTAWAHYRPKASAHAVCLSKLEAFALGRLGVASKSEAEVLDLLVAAMTKFVMPSAILPVRIDHRACKRLGISENFLTDTRIANAYIGYS